MRIFGVEYELNAEVVTINAFSGHADKNELVDFVQHCLPLKRIFLVHGDYVLHLFLVLRLIVAIIFVRILSFL